MNSLKSLREKKVLVYIADAFRRALFCWAYARPKAGATGNRPGLSRRVKKGLRLRMQGF
jgi:hypothetical protein